jgi:hypothetical protein
VIHAISYENNPACSNAVPPLKNMTVGLIWLSRFFKWAILIAIEYYRTTGKLGKHVFGMLLLRKILEGPRIRMVLKTASDQGQAELIYAAICIYNSMDERQ